MSLCFSYIGPKMQIKVLQVLCSISAKKNSDRTVRICKGSTSFFSNILKIYAGGNSTMPILETFRFHEMLQKHVHIYNTIPFSTKL